MHRVDDGIDSGPMLDQTGGIPLDDDVTRDGSRPRLAPAVREVLSTALAEVERQVPRRPQSDAGACRAGMMECGFSLVDWSRPARETITRCGCTGSSAVKLRRSRRSVTSGSGWCAPAFNPPKGCVSSA